jgi:ATP-binding cassette, subfamily C (CFTR/MRP), member 1
LQTRIFVTHGIHWLPQVDNVVVLSNGVISETGSYEELLSQNQSFAQFLKTYFTQEDHKEDDEDADR